MKVTVPNLSRNSLAGFDPAQSPAMNGMQERSENWATTINRANTACSETEDKTMSFSLHRLRTSVLANEALSMPLDPTERAAMINGAANAIASLFDALQIDYHNDHNTRDTPKRVAKMFVSEILDGRFSEPPAITEFDNAEGFDQLLITGPIEVRSMCAHHLMPIYGEAYIGVLPAADGKIIGLSKYDRIVDHFASRLQIQEEMVKQIGQFIVEKTQPRGLAVRISAVHMCKTHRGVRSSHRGRMVTSAFFGEMEFDTDLRKEFQQECLALGQTN
jgi:GTP cyclohydrolase I